MLMVAVGLFLATEERDPARAPLQVDGEGASPSATISTMGPWVGAWCKAPGRANSTLCVTFVLLYLLCQYVQTNGHRFHAIACMQVL